MDNAGYVALGRQAGLLQELQTVANNIANLSTAGYRREGVIFAEHVKRLDGDELGSLSIATARGRVTDPTQGTLSQTGGRFDFAIEGDGFFVLQTPDGPRLTRAGSFTPNGQGDLVDPDGFPVLDAGGTPIFIPPDVSVVALAPDGTLSADGLPLAQIGVVAPEDQATMTRQGGTMFRSDGGFQQIENPMVAHGFIEQSNVSAVSEMARMIEIQRAYELGQKILDREDERMRATVRVLGQ